LSHLGSNHPAEFPHHPTTCTAPRVSHGMQCSSVAIPQLPNQPSTSGRLTARPASARWFSHDPARTPCYNYTTLEGVRGFAAGAWQASDGMGWDGQGEGGLQESAGWTGWPRVAERARLPLAARCDRCDRGKSTWQRPRCPVFCSFTHTQYHILALNPAGHTSHRGAPSHLLSRFVHIPSAILRCRSCAVPSHY
jgi:hypothetical protein